MNYKLLSEVALSFAAHESFSTQLGRALQSLSYGLQLSRAYVFLDGQERSTMGPIHEWCAEGIAHQWMQDIPYASYDAWRQMLVDEGKILASDVSSLSADLKDTLSAHGIQSLLVFPIEANDEIAGFVGFDDCVRQRVWRDEEIDILEGAAAIISAFCECEILRERLEAKQLASATMVDGSSIHDPLTGIFNKRHVLERMKEFDAEYARLGRNFCVSILDLDNFRSINYNYGREAGDLILGEFAGLISAAIRPYDVCGRYGGEEFIIVSVNADAAETAAMIERIMSIVRGRVFLYNGMEIRIRFSCGIADSSEIPLEEISIEKLVELANRRMFAAKMSGRDRLIAS